MRWLGSFQVTLLFDLRLFLYMVNIIDRVIGQCTYTPLPVVSVIDLYPHTLHIFSRSIITNNMLSGINALQTEGRGGRL